MELVEARQAMVTMHAQLNGARAEWLELTKQKDVATEGWRRAQARFDEMASDMLERRHGTFRAQLTRATLANMHAILLHPHVLVAHLACPTFPPRRVEGKALDR